MENIIELLKNNRANEALIQLENVLEKQPENIEALLLQGEIYRKKEDFGKALNSFNKVLNLYPNHNKANHYKTIIMNILNYKNKDMYNP